MQNSETASHLKQIKAGARGRKNGHSFEVELVKRINSMSLPYFQQWKDNSIIVKGRAECILVDKILNYLNWSSCDALKAYAAGTLATSEEGVKELLVEGKSIKSSKSDVIVVLENSNNKKVVGISVKQCNNKCPTNAQLLFTTATAFFNLLVENGISLSENALCAMRQFCGDYGFRPKDDFDCSERISTPERYFWEEINSDGKREWEEVLCDKQDEITRLLLQKGYKDDPFAPEIIFHKTKMTNSNDEEIAVFTMDEFVELSRKFSSFGHNLYRVKKGRYKEPEGVIHQAPRFGVIQMQRGGQKQHPTQLQFNLKAGYFYKLAEI